MWREGTSTADFADAVANVSHVTLPTDGAVRVTIPDTELLFSAKYSRAGSDLVLTGADGHKLVVTGYFDHEKHADLVAPGGASLSADLVAKLTISQTPGQYAQAGAPAGAMVIGKVERLGGTATVQHANGTVEELHIGDAIYQGDVIETSGGSQLGLSLNDGTAFNMGANARMVLNELTYDSAGSANAGIFSLVKGSISFVAGQVAKNGDMRVETPVATMGIRGTSVNTNISADINGNIVSVTYSLMADPDGHIGSFNILDKTTGAIIGTISTTDTTFVITPAANLSVLATQTDKTPEQVQQELEIARVLFPIFLSNPANFLTNPNPNVNPNDLQPKKGGVGSGWYLDFQGHSTGLGSVAELNAQTTLFNDNPQTRLINEIVSVTVFPDNGVPETVTQTIQVQLPNNFAPLINGDTPPHLKEAPSNFENGSTSVAQLTKSDIDGTASYDIAALLAAGWTDNHNGTFSKDGQYGTVTLNIAANTLTYQLDQTKADPLNVDDHPVEAFTIPVVDNQGATNSTVVSFTIDGANDAPTITASVNHHLVEASGFNPGVWAATATLTKGDVDGTASYDTAALSAGGWFSLGFGIYTKIGHYGVATLNTNTGKVTYLLDNFRANSLAAGETVHDDFTVPVKDDRGATGSTSVSFVIDGTNDKPVIFGKTTGAVKEDGGPCQQTATGQLVAVDVDHGATATWSVVGNTAGTYGAIAIDSSGKWTYTLNNDSDSVQSLAQGEIRFDTFTIKVDDGKGGVDTQVVKIKVTGTNDAPTIKSVVDHDLVEASGSNPGVWTATATLTKGDVDGTASYDTAALSSDGWVTFGFGIYFKLGNYGLATLDINSGKVTYVLDNIRANALNIGDHPTDDFTIPVKDNLGATNSTVVSFTIDGTNDAPVILVSLPQPLLLVEDSVTTAVAHLTKGDVDGIASYDADALTSHGWTDNNDGTFTKDGQYGTATLNTATNAVTYALDPAKSNPLAFGQTVTESFFVGVVDNNGATSSASASFIVTGTNDAPVVDLDTTMVGSTATLEYIESNPLTAIAPHAAVTDVDSANFRGGSLTVSFTANGTSSDQLKILTDDVVSVTGANHVKVNGIDIGTINGGNNGVNGAPLKINFTSNAATPDVVSTLMQHIGFENTSSDPSSAARTVTFKVVDGDGVLLGGHDTGQMTAIVTVQPVTYFVGGPHSNFATIQAAIDAAHDGDTILVAPGTYNESLNINKGVKILGANAGVDGNGTRGPETVIIGQAIVTAGAILDGLRIENHTNNSTQFIGIRVKTGQDVTIENTVFYSYGPNGNTNDRAIYLDTTAQGHVTIADNLISGDTPAKYGSAGWHQAIWSDGSASQLDITGNTIEYARTAIDLENYKDDHTNISGNTFFEDGTGVSIATPTGATITGIHDNAFNGVDLDFNLSTIATAQSLDLGATHNVAGTTPDDATGVMKVFGTSGGDTITGTSGADFLDARDHEDGRPDTASNVLDGRGGDDVLLGYNGNDTLIGGAGNDKIDGGAGTDTAVYATLPNVSGISFDSGTGTWTVDATAGGEGTDQLTNVEQISDGTHHILLVSNSATGGYTTIQAAITAAQDGDTILIAAGTYNENLTIAGKHLTITGAGDSGPNATTLTGQINASGTLTGALTIENIAINATGHQYGVFVSSDGTTGSIVLDNTTVWGAQNNGFAYIRAGNGSTPTLTDTVSAISILNSEFFNNATVSSGGNGRGDILLFGYNGDLTIDNVDIHDPGAAAQKAIQLRGLQTTGVDVADHGPYQAAGDFSLTNLTINGNYAQDLIAVYNIANFQSFTTSGMDIDASAPWGIINLDGVGGTIDLSSFNATNLSAGGLVAHQQGLDGVEIFTGTSGNDILDGRAGADVLNGGGGDDTIVGFSTGDVVNGGANNDTIVLTGTGANALGTALDTDIINVEAVSAAGATAGVTIDLHNQSEGFTITGSANNDTITGGNGADTIQGGAGIDTAVYATLPSVSAISFNSGTGTWTVDATASGQGVDQLSNVEQISDGSHRILLVSNSATGGYTSIQAAINAAHDGDTILIAAGTYNEQVVVNGLHGLTIQGLGAVTVTAPAGLLQQTAVSPTNGRSIDGIFTVINSDGVTIQNLTVDGQGKGNQFAAGQTNPHFAGIAYVDSDGGVVNHVNVTGVREPDASFGVQRNVGIYVVNTDPTPGAVPTAADLANHTLNTITIANSAVTDFQKGGIVVSNADVNIHDNTVTGIGATSLTAQNGIQVSGSTGSIAGNDVSGIGYTIPDTAATSILTFDNNGLSITGNHIHAATQGGLPVSSEGIDVTESINGVVTGNDIHDAAYAIVGLSEVFTANSLGGTFTVANNTADGVPANGAGVYFDTTPSASTSPMDIEGTNSQDFISGAEGTDTLKGFGGDDEIHGHGGNDMLTGGSGNDMLDGGAGTDTAVYTALPNVSGISFDSGTGTWTVNATASGEGTDHLSNVEQISDGTHHILLVSNSASGGYTTIQAAINAAHDGDTIMIADGTYAEHLTIDKELTLVGSAGAVVQGTFLTDNHITGSVADFLKTAPSYTGAAGNGITVAADNVTIQGITVNGFNSAINLGDGIHNTLIKNVTLSGSVNGIYKGTTADVTGLTVNGGTITDDYIGIYFAKVAGDGMATNIRIDGTAFNHLTQKGIYAEVLDHALITGITMNDVGQYGGGPAFGANGTNGAGIDINLKYGSYSNIDISDFHFTNVGASNGLGSSHFNAGAITVKARDDGAYHSVPASFTGAVTIENGTIDGTSTGIRAGEAHQNIAGPAVTVDNVVITNAVHNADHGDFANVTQSIMTVIGTSGDDVLFASPTTTGPLDITGGDGNDIYYVGHTATIHELPGGGIDEVRSTESIVLADNVEKATLLDGASNTQTFDNMSPGAITNGENGWKFAGPTVDQAVIDDGSGNHVFHISSDPSNGTFGGPYSPGLSVAAGEAAAGAAYQHQSISFDFEAANPLGDNSRIEVDFANAAGTDRNNFMVIESVAGQGIRIAVSEPDTSGDFSGNNDPFPIDWRELASGVDASAQHHLELRLDYIDGPNNDLISVYLDGVQIGTTTTFENYHDADPDNLYSYVDHSAAAKDYMTDRILFRVGNNGQPEDGAGGQNQGFNFDNVTSAVFNNTNVTGNAIDNVITGNSGNNTLTGGAGADTFVFTPNFGHDTVTDFAAGTDIISIDHTIFADTAAALAAATQQGADTVVTAQNGDTITLQNVNVANLHQNDFHIIA